MGFESVYVLRRQITSDISWKAIPNWATSKIKSTFPGFYVKRWHKYKSLTKHAEWNFFLHVLQVSFGSE